MSVHFTIPWAQGMESIPLRGGYRVHALIPGYIPGYMGMAEHPSTYYTYMNNEVMKNKKKYIAYIRAILYVLYSILY